MQVLYVTNAFGITSICSDEELLVQLLVKKVLIELSNTAMRVAAYTVGIDSRVEELLDFEIFLDIFMKKRRYFCNFVYKI